MATVVERYRCAQWGRIDYSTTRTKKERSDDEEERIRAWPREASTSIIFSRNFLFLIIGNQLKFPSESSSMDIFIIQPYVILDKASDQISPCVMMFVLTDLLSLSSCWDQLNDIGQGFLFTTLVFEELTSCLSLSIAMQAKTVPARTKRMSTVLIR